MDPHFDAVLSVDTSRRGPKTAYSVGNDNQLKAWSYPDPTTAKSNTSVRKYGLLHTEVFDYDSPIAVAAHPLGIAVAVLFLDRLRYYYSCFDGLQVGWADSCGRRAVVLLR